MTKVVNRSLERIKTLDYGYKEGKEQDSLAERQPEIGNAWKPIKPKSDTSQRLSQYDLEHRTDPNKAILIGKLQCEITRCKKSFVAKSSLDNPILKHKRSILELKPDNQTGDSLSYVSNTVGCEKIFSRQLSLDDHLRLRDHKWGSIQWGKSEVLTRKQLIKFIRPCEMLTLSEARQMETVKKKKEVRILDGNVQIQLKAQEPEDSEVEAEMLLRSLTNEGEKGVILCPHWRDTRGITNLPDLA